MLATFIFVLDSNVMSSRKMGQSCVVVQDGSDADENRCTPVEIVVVEPASSDEKDPIITSATTITTETSGPDVSARRHAVILTL